MLLAGCSGADSQDAAGPGHQGHGTEPAEPSDSTEQATGHSGHSGTAKPVKSAPLRKGESRVTVEMGESYTPSAPYGTGTDDYRCFLLDPELTDPAWLTGTQVVPGNPNVVHHVILFRVPPEKAKLARAKDEWEEGPGWTCFGGTGLDTGGQVNNAPWLAAWAPGAKESVMKPGFGTRLEPGTQIVMQVHYNLLNGAEPDVSATQLRLSPGTRDLEDISTVLLTAPVEMPCRKGRSDGALCDRDAAIADVKERFGEREGNTANLLHLLCGTEPSPSPTQSCTRAIGEPLTIHAVAGHMHLLGRSIKVETNPGTPQARTILDTKVWNFDDQAARPIKPVQIGAYDPVKITCTHDQSLRDLLPAFEHQREDKYVVWGDGSTDEMCLGMLLVTRG